MSPKQERRLHVSEHKRAGGQRTALADTWRATLPKATISPQRSGGGIGPNRQSRLRGRRPEGEARAKPAGRGTGRLRLGKRSAPEHAPRAIGGGARVSPQQERRATLPKAKPAGRGTGGAE